jgi:hypothetical protein
MPSLTSDRISGLSTSAAVKAPVKVVAITNVTQSGEQTVNGIACVDGDRVLCIAQSDQVTNGIWEVRVGAWNRAPDFDGARDVRKGTLVVSNTGTTIYYRVTTADPVNVGISNVTFEEVSGSVTQASIGAALYPRTAAEIASGVVPTAYQYEPLDVRRYGADETAVSDSTTAIQAAIDVAYGAGGGHVRLSGGDYLVNDTLHLGTRVILDFEGGLIRCTTDDIPVIIADKDALNSFWQIRNGTITFLNQQTSAETNGVGIRLSTTSKVSYEYVIENMTISRSLHAVDLPELTGCTAFLGMHRNVRASSFSGYAFNILGDTAGARTSLTFDQCYAAQTNGSEIAGSAVGVFKRTQDLRLIHLAGDHCQGTAGGRLVFIEACSGVAESIMLESCDITISSGTGSCVELSGSRMVMGVIKTVDNIITISGSASFGVLRTSSGCVASVGLIEDINTTVTDTSSGAYYTIIPSAGDRVKNDFYFKTGSTPTASIAEFGVNSVQAVEVFNGNVRTWSKGSRTELYGNAPPTTGTYVVGDRIVNREQSAASPVTGWVCVTAGTPGTWRQYAHHTFSNTTANRPTLTTNDRGVMYFDTTLDADGKPIWWNGTAWVDATGATV